MAKQRVLLVDDEEDFVVPLAERMGDRGLDVDVCLDGKQALEQAQKRVYDAVILDLTMPGMDGIETLKRLLATNSDLQVILLTGQASVRAGVEAMSSGAMEFLEKPASIELLMEKIKDAQTNRVVLAEKRAQEQVNDILRRKGW